MTRTLALVLIATAAIGLGVGAGGAHLMAQRTTGSPTVALAAPEGNGGGGSDGAAAFAAKPGGGGFGGNSGTVETVDASTATVKTASGSSVSVTLADATIQKQVKVAASDLKVGDQVLGRGESDAQGVMKLASLQILPAGRGPGAGFAAAKPGNPGGGGQGGQRGGGAQAAADGASGPPRGFVAGSVAKTDGKTLTITAPNGTQMTAAIVDDTQIERIIPAAATDLKAGQSVAVARGPGAQGATVLTITSG